MTGRTFNTHRGGHPVALYWMGAVAFGFTAAVVADPWHWYSVPLAIIAAACIVAIVRTLHGFVRPEEYAVTVSGEGLRTPQRMMGWSEIDALRLARGGVEVMRGGTPAAFLSFDLENFSELVDLVVSKVRLPAVPPPATLRTPRPWLGGTAPWTPIGVDFDERELRIRYPLHTRAIPRGLLRGIRVQAREWDLRVVAYIAEVRRPGSLDVKRVDPFLVYGTARQAFPDVVA